tara:strand:+ start:417 stop:671 length:255 start_codon:yes stop_codon:yes gene_type:complete
MTAINEHNFACFCGLLCIIYGKKLNLPNIFILLLQNKIYRTILKELIDVDTDFALFKFCINYDPTISKSKYISKFLNKQGEILF